MNSDPYNDGEKDLLAIIEARYLAVIAHHADLEQRSRIFGKKRKSGTRKLVGFPTFEERTLRWEAQDRLYEQAVIAVELIVASRDTSDLMYRPDLTQARNALELILQDVEWLARSGDARRVADALRKLMRRLDMIRDVERAWAVAWQMLSDEHSHHVRVRVRKRARPKRKNRRNVATSTWAKPVRKNPPKSVRKHTVRSPGSKTGSKKTVKPRPPAAPKPPATPKKEDQS